MTHDRLPGAEIVREGIKDLAEARESVASLLVSIAAPRLRRLGIAVPQRTIAQADLRLYARLAAEHGRAAHSRYNAWRRRLVSFLRSAECALS